MRKFTQIKKITAAAMLLAIIIPGAASAHNGNQGGNEDNDNGRWARGISKLQKHFRNRTQNGTVETVGTASFTMKTENDTVFTVNVDNETKITKPFDGTGQFSDITVNSKVQVKGEVDNNTIDANRIVVTPPNTHAAVAKGTVKSITGTSFIIESSHRGVEYDVKINTSTSTVFRNNGNATTTTSTMANLTVGAKVKIKGLWDEILNVLNAIRIRIK